MSYDYSDLLDELKQDIEKFGWEKEDTLFIVRGEEIVHTHFLIKTTKVYAPIVDYYYGSDVIDEPMITTTVGKVLKEMNTMNEMI